MGRSHSCDHVKQNSKENSKFTILPQFSVVRSSQFTKFKENGKVIGGVGIVDFQGLAFFT